MYRQEKLCLDIVTVPHGSLMLSDIAMEDGSCTDILLWFSKTTLNCQRIGDWHMATENLCFTVYRPEENKKTVL